MSKNAKAATASTSKKTAEPKAVAFIAANALSTDVGAKAMEAFRISKNEDAKIAELSQENTKRKGETLKTLTLAFVKAATADKNIRLADCQSDTEKQVRALREKLEVAVGIRTVAQNADGTNKIELAPWTKEYLPQPGEDKESEDWRRKENFRTNFSAVLKKAMAAAHAISHKGIHASEDKATGALLISGPAVKERFGHDNILLNEKREIKEGDRKIELKKIPSFTELTRISAESVGKAAPVRVDSRKPGSGKVTEKDMIAAITSLQNALSKFSGFGDDMATALEGLQDTIETALAQNQGSEG
jgi:hypothetical protein